MQEIFPTIPQMLKASAEKFAHDPALQMRQEDGTYRKFDYKDFYDAVKKVGAFLIKEGIKKNDKVILVSENRPEWPIVYFGVTNIGAVIVPLDPKLEHAEIKNLVENSDSIILFSSEQLMGKVDQIKDGLTKIKRIVNIDTELPKIIGDPVSSEIAAEIVSAENNVRLEDLLSIIYTSGTTGNPKGVMLTNKNVMSDATMASPIFWMLGPGDSFLSVLPNYHTFETMAMFYALLKGCCTTYAESLKSYNLLRNMQETRANIICAVPLLYKLFSEGIDRQIDEKGVPAKILFKILFAISKASKSLLHKNIGKKLFGMVQKKFGGNIKFFVSGGAALDPDIIRKFDLMGFTIVQGYGLTETSPILSACTLDNNIFGSVGKPLPGIEIKINNPSKDGIGEIIAKGPNVMIGYYKNEAASKEVLKDGWFYTGDLGRFDEKGNLYITGRCKDVIVLGSGVNVYPDEVEFTLSKSPFVSEICVFGHVIKGGIHSGMEEVHAAVVPNMECFASWALKTGSTLNDEMIKKVIVGELDQLGECLTSYKRIVKYHITREQLPKTATRKIKRFVVKNMFAEK